MNRLWALACIGMLACGATADSSRTSATAHGSGKPAPGDPPERSTPDVVIQPEPPPPPPPPPPARLVRITVVSAEIQGHMANGEHWDGNPGAAPPRTPELLTRYLARHPELDTTAQTLGIPVDDEALLERTKTTPAADPMVLVEVDPQPGQQTVYRSPVHPRSFTPLWSFSFELLYGNAGDRHGIPRGTVARIHVVDYDGPMQFEPIGSTVVALDDLLAKPVHDLGPFGGVARLTLQIQATDVPEALPSATSVRMAISSKPAWTDTGIDLVAGQRVTIHAADEVCLKDDALDRCTGPEGERAPSKHNLRGFEELGHGALVAALGDTRFPIQRGRDFVAPSSGRLRLGVNDRDNANNRGAYAVHVLVHPLP